MTLPCPVATLARATPNANAITFEGTTWTFAHLARQVADCEKQLAHLPVNARVGLLHGNHPNMVAFMVAAARRGICTVLLNTRLALPELNRLHAIAGLQAVFADAPNACRWPAATRLELQARNQERLTEQPIDDVATAFILFTSGTTGIPKGACLTLANLHASAVASGTNLGAGPTQVWLGTLPLFHVGGLAMVWRCLFYGATLSLHARFDVQDTLRTLTVERITHASLVPTTLKRLLEVHTLPALPALRAVLVGGGPCPDELLLSARARGIPVVATYGLTEATSQVATQSPNEPPVHGARPLMGMEVRVVDAQRAAMATGQEGDIEVRGPTVMRGYVDNAEATAQALDEQGWLRTRDLGKLDAEGRLTALARRTDLIICGGENVYPAEIEAALLAHPQVEDAAVVGHADAEWGQVPTAYVVLRSDVSGDGLKAYCKERLASFKVPQTFHVVHELPRNTMGKVDRTALARTR